MFATLGNGRHLTWLDRANFASLCAWMIGTIFMAITALTNFGQDFRSFYAASRVLVAGGDPYDFRQVSQALLEVTGRMGNYAYYSPPWFLVPLLPLAYLPYSVARALWMIFNVALWIIGLAATTTLLPPTASPYTRRLLHLAATFLFAWITWRYEQTGIFICFLLAVAGWSIRSGRATVAGIALALMLSKPTVTLVMMLVLLVWLWQNHHLAALKGFAFGSLGLLVVSLPLLSTWLMHLRDPQFTAGLFLVFDGPDTIEGTRINTTLTDWLRSFGADQEAIKLIGVMAITLCFALLATMLLRHSSFDAVASVAAIATFWVTPYALQYDFPPLVFPLFFAFRSLHNRPGSIRALASAIFVFMLSVPFWEKPISDGFWIVIAMSLFLSIAILPRPVIRSASYAVQ